MKILYIPLDERPCNYAYPLEMMAIQDDVEIAYPPRDYLGLKKEGAQIEKIWNFIQENVEDGDVLILSDEMLTYGGLIPSRLHHYDEGYSEEIIQRIRNIKEKHPKTKIYMSSMIMRTPQYDSDDEEPFYYENYGKKIFQYGVYLHRKEKGSLSEEDAKQFSSLKKSIPVDYIEDFKERRAYNLEHTQKIIDLVEEGIIDFMVIPQDDSHVEGFTVLDQEKVYPRIRQLGLEEKIMIYPGADEVGYSLLARAYNYIQKKSPQIYVFYSSINGPYIVPSLEDREIGESLKSHIQVVGASLTGSPENADIILAYNSPGIEMMPSSSQIKQRSISFDRNRNIPYFVKEIKNYLDQNKKLSLVDAAFGNGGDLQVLRLLSNESDYLERLKSYRAWNTNCNTLGSVISESCVFNSLQGRHPKHRKYVFSKLIDDVLYQSLVRFDLTDHHLEDLGINYFDLKEKQNEVIELAKQQIIALRPHYFKNNFKEISNSQLEIEFPWNRMFEIRCQIKDC